MDDLRRDREIKLTAEVSCSGWAAKVGPAVLGELLKKFVPPRSERLLVGIEGVDDAGVYQLDDDTALVLTVDFFPPIVDDPYVFGQVAAANALSDVYAMGGRPVTALNILCFPATLPVAIVGEILRGGADKIAEAGAVIAGGHTVKDNEIKYGLAVTGLIHPRKIITNGAARPGDQLLLTKPLGTGIISTALKCGRATQNEIAALTAVMISLNRVAGEAMFDFGVHAATDITGFGLAGHAYEMAAGSGVSLEIEFSSLSLLPGAVEHARDGMLTGGAASNRQYLEGKVDLAVGLEKIAGDIIFDPQTSGGLLMAVPPDRVEAFRQYLLGHGIDARPIGRVTERSALSLYIH